MGSFMIERLPANQKFSFVNKHDRYKIHQFLFQEGVMIANKDRNLVYHDVLTDVKNIHVLLTLKSLASKGYVTETFSWMVRYYTLTETGVTYLRDVLNLDQNVVPKTYFKSRQTRPRTTDARSSVRARGGVQSRSFDKRRIG